MAQCVVEVFAENNVLCEQFGAAVQPLEHVARTPELFQESLVEFAAPNKQEEQEVEEERNRRELKRPKNSETSTRLRVVVVSLDAIEDQLQRARWYLCLQNTFQEALDLRLPLVLVEKARGVKDSLEKQVFQESPLNLLFYRASSIWPVLSLSGLQNLLVHDVKKHIAGTIFGSYVKRPSLQLATNVDPFRSVARKALECFENSLTLHMDRVREWVSDPLGQKVLCFVGSIGTGKSVLASTLALEGGLLFQTRPSSAAASRGFLRKSWGGLKRAVSFSTSGTDKSESIPTICVIAAHFFGEHSRLSVCIASIANQLALAFPALARELEIRQGNLSSESLDNLTLFRRLLCEPCTRMLVNDRKGGAPSLVVLDGVDQVEDEDKDDLLAILHSLWNAEMPSWIKLVVTTRNEKSLFPASDVWKVELFWSNTYRYLQFFRPPNLHEFGSSFFSSVAASVRGLARNNFLQWPSSLVYDSALVSYLLENVVRFLLYVLGDRLEDFQIVFSILVRHHTVPKRVLEECLRTCQSQSQSGAEEDVIRRFDSRFGIFLLEQPTRDGNSYLTLPYRNVFHLLLTSRKLAGKINNPHSKHFGTSLVVDLSKGCRALSFAMEELPHEMPEYAEEHMLQCLLDSSQWDRLQEYLLHFPHFRRFFLSFKNLSERIEAAIFSQAIDSRFCWEAIQCAKHPISEGSVCLGVLSCIKDETNPLLQSLTSWLSTRPEAMPEYLVTSPLHELPPQHLFQNIEVLPAKDSIPIGGADLIAVCDGLAVVQVPQTAEPTSLIGVSLYEVSTWTLKDTFPLNEKVYLPLMTYDGQYVVLRQCVKVDRGWSFSLTSLDTDTGVVTRKTFGAVSESMCLNKGVVFYLADSAVQSLDASTLETEREYSMAELDETTSDLFVSANEYAVFASTSSGRVILWERDTGTSLRVFDVPAFHRESSLLNLDATSDFLMVTMATPDTGARTDMLLEWETGKLVHGFESSLCLSNHASCFVSGKILIAVSDAQVWFWSLETQALVASMGIRDVLTQRLVDVRVSFTDGTLLLWSRKNSKAVRSLRLETCMEHYSSVQRQLPHTGNSYVRCVCVHSPWVFSGGSGGDIAALDATSGTVLHRLPSIPSSSGTSSVSALACSEDVLIAGYSDGTVSFLSLANLTEEDPSLHRLCSKPNDSPVCGVTIHGSTAVSVHLDGRCRVWSVPEGELVQELGERRSLDEFDPWPSLFLDDQVLCVGFPGRLDVWERSSLQRRGSLDVNSFVLDVRVVNGYIIAMIGQDSCFVAVYNVQSLQFVCSGVMEDYFASGAFSDVNVTKQEDDQLAVSVSHFHVFQQSALWHNRKTFTGRGENLPFQPAISCVLQLSLYRARISEPCVSTSPDGSRVAVGDADQVRLLLKSE